MANALYNKGREGFLNGSYNWNDGTIKACLVTNIYTPDLATDEFLSDVGSGNIVATSGAFTGKTETDGVADSDNVVFSAVTGDDAHFIVLFVDTGDPTTSRLVGLIDTAVGLPVTPNGGDITINWDTGDNKIFKL